MSIQDQKPNTIPSKLDQFASFTVDVIYDRREDTKARVWATILKGLSFVFYGLSALRYQLYRHRLMRAQHLGCQVIVVGNLTVGGTGKTPIVEKLARSLNERGRKVAILSRGYKSKKEPFYKKWFRLLTHTEAAPPRVVSDGKVIYFDSDVAGDEPYMLSKNLPGVLVITDKDRVKAGLYAIRKYGVDTLILDDGFQYFQLKDHLQLLLIDKSNPFGNGNVLPRGILREPIKRMKRASHVFYTKSDGKPNPDLDALVQRYRPGIEPIECNHTPKFFKEVNGEEQFPLTYLEGKRVGALSGIAVPESFESFLDDLGVKEVVPYRFLDHHRFTPKELHAVAKRAIEAGLECLVTTEKDAVRISDDFDPGIPFYYLRVEIEMLAGEEDFDSAVNRICFPQQSGLSGLGSRRGMTTAPFPPRK